MMSNSAKQMPINESESVHSVKSSKKHRREGEFIARQSLLTELLQISHINCIRNAFIASFIIMIFRQIINDFIHYGRLNWTFELLFSTVGKLHIVGIVWCLMTLCTSFVVFYGTCSSMNNRKFTKFSLKVYDRIWLWIYICYLACLLVIPCWQIIKYQLPFVSSSIIIAEQLRQLMKTHSFVRENVGKVVQQSNEHFTLKFSQYIYFLFAPTLIYRDNYPRTSRIQWNIVIKMFGEFLIGLIVLYNILANFWMITFKRCFTTSEITFEFTMSAIFDLMIPGVLVIILCFYGFFHCWLNGFAELLRFADRMFYEDWWNFTSAATFWRSWNVVVHDWLYIYVYKDLNKLCNCNRKLSATCVVIVSAIFHEYFMTVTFRFFSPILIVWFGLFGMLLRFAFPHAKGAHWNIVLLTFLPVCASLIPYLYALQVSAQYLPFKRRTFWSTMFDGDKQSEYGEL